MSNLDAIKNNEDDILRDNIFIKYSTDLYDMKVLHEHNDPDNYETRVIKKGLFKKKTIKVNKLEEEYYKNLKEFIKSELHEDSDTPLSFSTIWQFCQFIRWVEKIVFWDNDLSNRVIVDSGIKDGVINDNPRYIVFQGHNIATNIKLELNRVKINQINSVLNLDNIPEKSEVINLEVVRTFGKKMSSRYVIVDGIVNYNDISDIYLINTVNKIVKDAIIHTFKTVIFNIETMQPFSDFNTNIDKEIDEFFTSHLF